LLPQLSIGIFIRSEEIAASAIELLRGERYALTHIKSAVEFLGFLKHNYHLDCLVFEVDRDLRSLLGKLQERSIFLPAVIFSPQPGVEESPKHHIQMVLRLQPVPPTRVKRKAVLFFITLLRSNWQSLDRAK
jgi:hypothetical protein